MEEDISPLREVLTTQASHTDPDPDEAVPHAEAPAPVQTPLEDASSTASQGVGVGQKGIGQEENDEMGKMSGFSLCTSVPDVALLHDSSKRTSCAAKRGEKIGKKNSRKRRNRKEGKTIYLPWPLMLQTRASSAAQVLGQTCTPRALPFAEVELQSEHAEKERASVLTEPWKALADSLLPAARPVQPFLDKDFLAHNEEIRVGQKSCLIEREERRKKVGASPWPLTVQAWASFTGPAPIQPRASPVGNDRVNVGQKSRSQRGEQDKASILSPGYSAEAGATHPPVPLGQTSWEEQAYRTANSGEDVKKHIRLERRSRKSRSTLTRPWPLTVQAWASFTVADPVQTLLQGESPAASREVNAGWESQPRLDSEEESKAGLPWSGGAEAAGCFSATAPLQTSLGEAPFLEDSYSKLNKARRMPKRGDEGQSRSSVEPVLQSCQGWGNEDRDLGVQDFWECTVDNVPKQVDCYYGGGLLTREVARYDLDRNLYAYWYFGDEKAEKREGKD
ncbi:uncharacterized protein [Oryctolagus cuniculus]|uniref:uncharacterized protein n=1 Tax=Oryctolagus cuniculus TaxID=9986 RepID=UPI003879DF66